MEIEYLLQYTGARLYGPRMKGLVNFWLVPIK